MPSGHVPRTAIEARLANELLVTDRHPIVSLTGSGGIGKTTIAIAAINTISERVEPPFEVAVWISARDIDLLDEGPKPVASHVVTKSEIANAVVDLVGKSHDDSRSAEGTVQDWFLSGTSGPTLFVFDNFETVYDPADVFKWIDTYIRPPNKVLITTRVRDFVGDYPIEITGMNEQEARTLIDNQANRLGISELLNYQVQNDR